MSFQLRPAKTRKSSDARDVSLQGGTLVLVQAHGPGANRTQAWSGLLRCGMLGVLHAGLLSDG